MAEHSIPTPDEPIGDPDQAVLEAAAAIIADVHSASVSYVPQRKRLNRALADLGLLDLLGMNWIELEGDEISFASIDRRTLDALVRRLEDLAPRRSVPSRRPGPAQPTLDFDRPAPAAAPSAFHAEVK